MNDKKQAIIVVSFGVSNQEARVRCIAPVFRDIAAAFPEYDVYEAWTCNFIRKKLDNQGIHYDSFEKSLERLFSMGYKRVIVQPTHLTAGEEFYNKIKVPAMEWTGRFNSLAISEPALTGVGPESYSRELLEMLCQLEDLNEGEALVFMGHGSPHQHNPVYEWLQSAIDSYGMPVHVGVVEDSDTPNKQMVIERLKVAGVRKVLLRPLLLVGGSHVDRDMAGDGPDSWRSHLISAGFSVRCAKASLGELPEYRNIYIKRLEAIQNNN